MKHTQIAVTTMTAAATAFAQHVQDDAEADLKKLEAFMQRQCEHAAALYRYARERAFPKPETLWRKVHEFAGEAVEGTFAEIHEAERSFFTAFQAVAQALEPFHDGSVPPPAADDEILKPIWLKGGDDATPAEPVLGTDQLGSDAASDADHAAKGAADAGGNEKPADPAVDAASGEPAAVGKGAGGGDAAAETGTAKDAAKGGDAETASAGDDDGSADDQGDAKTKKTGK